MLVIIRIPAIKTVIERTIFLSFKNPMIGRIIRGNNLYKEPVIPANTPILLGFALISRMFQTIIVVNAPITPTNRGFAKQNKIKPFAATMSSFRGPLYSSLALMPLITKPLLPLRS